MISPRTYHISIDGGALCSQHNERFGTYSVTVNLLRALGTYDTTNAYSVYTFCQRHKTLYNIKSPNIAFQTLRPAQGWMKYRVSLAELMQKHDIFLALNQALPLYARGKRIVFCHGLSFYYHPDLYTNIATKLQEQMSQYLRHADHIVVSSRRVRKELQHILPTKNTPEVHVLPFGIPFELQTYEKKAREPFFLHVGSNQQIKNKDFLIDTFLQYINTKRHRTYKLYIVGAKRSDIIHPDIIFLPHTSAEKLKDLYQRATAYLTCSLYESFNFPVIEAISQRCPVIGLKSALIPEHTDFVYTARDQKEMLDYMKKVSTGRRKSIDIAVFEGLFSWQEFVRKLTLLYTSV